MDAAVPPSRSALDSDAAALRRLASSVLATALGDAQRGDRDAIEWLGAPGAGVGRVRWWIARAGLDPEQAARLAEAARLKRPWRVRRAATQAPRSRSGLRGEAHA